MKIIKSLISNDEKTIKYLQKTEDNNIIETGYYDLDEHIICISSQIGCLMNCIFCATTASIDSPNPDKHFIRNLTSEEIIRQVKNILNSIDQNKLKAKRILFSYMGMGEPFLNYKNVVRSIKILSKEFPNSRTTVSTTGIKPELMEKLADEKIDTILKLHLSLHAPNDTLRKKILPKAQKIKPALEALKYFSLTRKTPSKVNYILIKNINDSKNHAIQLAKLLQSYPFTVKLSNLNDFNNLESSNIDKFDMFEKILNSYKIKTCRFFSIGTDIQAGCGQLRRHFYDKLK
jgi:23S rRNA (adenine2503-C2)-methyltransferase